MSDATPGKRLWDRIHATAGSSARGYWWRANPGVKKDYERVGAEIEAALAAGRGDTEGEGR